MRFSTSGVQCMCMSVCVEENKMVKFDADPELALKEFKHLILREKRCQHLGVGENNSKTGEHKTREHGVTEARGTKCLLKFIMVTIVEYQVVMECEKDSLDHRRNLNGVVEAKLIDEYMWWIKKMKN